MMIYLQILWMFVHFKMKNINYFLLIFCINFLFSKHQSINSGPMVGYSEKMEVALWIQTNKEADVKFIYWDINTPKLADGSYPLMHDKGHVGALLKGLFGYNGDPSGIELAVWVCAIFGMNFMWRKVSVLK